jgi:OmpA family
LQKIVDFIQDWRGHGMSEISNWSRNTQGTEAAIGKAQIMPKFDLTLEARPWQSSFRDVKRMELIDNLMFVHDFGSASCQEAAAEILPPDLRTNINLCDPAFFDDGVMQDFAQRQSVEVNELQVKQICESDFSLSEKALGSVDFLTPGDVTGGVPDVRQFAHDMASQINGGRWYCVVGYADETGDHEKNQVLGLRRAKEVIRQYKEQKHVNGSKLIAGSRGDRKPAEGAWGADGANRRVQIRPLRLPDNIIVKSNNTR